ncbi:MAG: LysR family transcriptional regulator [Gammaproteobacteria bacterium]|nr:LysR family transcriptional regulator [Gammaproteobacteria bacterium]
MESLQSMHLFVRVVRAGSFSAAGRDLGLAPSSISRQVNALEDELGVRLLNRTTRALNLTQAGMVYFERASQILDDVEAAHREVSELDAKPRGTLRITAPVTFGRLHVATALPGFLALNPELQVEFTASDQVVDLIEEGVDVAIRIAPLKDSSLVARRLAPMHRVICASPDYLRIHGVPRTPQDLAEHQCLVFRSQSSSNLWRPGGGSWMLKSAEESVEMQVQGRFVSNNADVLVEAARQGLGLVHMPNWLVADDVRCGRLQQVLPEYQVGPDDRNVAIYAVYPSRRHLSAKIRAFVDYMSEHLTGLANVDLGRRARDVGQLESVQ